MQGDVTPALRAWLAELGARNALAQVLVRREGDGFELRHVADASRPAEELRLVPSSALRSLAQTTAQGLFRPLRAAPNLQRGWRVVTGSASDLEAALNALYPGALADWFAFRSASATATEFGAFVARQTGRFASVGQLSEAQAARLTRACCDGSVCLKRRLWAVGQARPDEATEKSSIPCFEPCAVWLEFATQVTNFLTSTPPAAEASRSADGSNASPGDDVPVADADFSDPRNPRRRLWQALAPPA
jgi:hypothetical protein